MKCPKCRVDNTGIRAISCFNCGSPIGPSPAPKFTTGDLLIYSSPDESPNINLQAGDVCVVNSVVKADGFVYSVRSAKEYEDVAEEDDPVRVRLTGLEDGPEWIDGRVHGVRERALLIVNEGGVVRRFNMEGRRKNGRLGTDILFPAFPAPRNEVISETERCARLVEEYYPRKFPNGCHPDMIRDAKEMARLIRESNPKKEQDNDNISVHRESAETSSGAW